MKMIYWSIALIFFGATLSSGPSLAAEAARPALSGSALYEVVKKYASFGDHRTGSPADLATSRWIAEELKQAGLDTALKPWNLRQFFLDHCRLTVDGKAVDCFPGWFPNTQPVKGKLAVYDPKEFNRLKEHIAFVGSKHGAVSNTGMLKLVEEAREAGALGLIVAVRNFADSGLLTAANAEQKGHGPEYHQTPLPLPTVIIAAEDEALLLKAAAEGKEAAFQVFGKTQDNLTAYNVVGTWKKGDRWVVVTTPTAGWFACAGERGPGVALFLGLARWAAQSDLPYSFIFIANSGHELAYMGAHYAFAEYLPELGITKDNVACWLHLGAAIACRSWKKSGKGFQPLPEANKVYYLAAVPELLPSVKAAFGGIPGLTIGSGRYAGELIRIVNGGFKGLGFFGANYFFHTPLDKPEETGPELLEPVGQALVRFFSALEKTK